MANVLFWKYEYNIYWQEFGETGFKHAYGSVTWNASLEEQFGKLHCN